MSPTSMWSATRGAERKGEVMEGRQRFRAGDHSLGRLTVGFRLVKVFFVLIHPDFGQPNTVLHKRAMDARPCGMYVWFVWSS
jgi:hypothetical protein